MKKKEGKSKPVKSSILLLLLSMTMILLAACGSSAKSTGNTAQVEMEAAAYDAAAPEEAADSMEIGVNSSTVTTDSGIQSQMAVSERKLIRTVDMDVETEKYDELMAGLEEQVSKLGGYIEYREAYYGNRYSSGSRSARLQIRIPAEKLDEFTGRVKEAGNVTRENESVEDVTLTYVDLESHKKMLLTEQERLMELLEQAETIEDIIALEGRLSEVRYQIESMEAQLRTYDNLVDYSTVNLYIEEVERYTPQPEKGAWERIKSGFSDNLYQVGKGLKNFCIELVISLPILAAWAAAIFILVLGVRLFLKWKKKKEEK